VRLEKGNPGAGLYRTGAAGVRSRSVEKERKKSDFTISPGTAEGNQTFERRNAESEGGASGREKRNRALITIQRRKIAKKMRRSESRRPRDRTSDGASTSKVNITVSPRDRLGKGAEEDRGSSGEEEPQIL